MVLTDEGRLKVTDFGIARAANAVQMTEVGSIVGTAQYLSPEQARGLDVGPQSDLYSMGVVLYEMLTGELPFTGDSAVEIAMKQVSDPPPSIRKQNRLVSRGAGAGGDAGALEGSGPPPPLGPADGRRAAPGAPRRGRLERHAAGDARAHRRRRVLPPRTPARRRASSARRASRRPRRARAAAKRAPVAARASCSSSRARPSATSSTSSSRAAGVTVPTPERELRDGQGAARGGPAQGRSARTSSRRSPRRARSSAAIPASGRAPTRIRTVTIFIGAGPNAITVPDVHGHVRIRGHDHAPGQGLPGRPGADRRRLAEGRSRTRRRQRRPRLDRQEPQGTTIQAESRDRERGRSRRHGSELRSKPRRR